MKVGQAKGAKRDQHGAERGAVDQEGPAGPERGDDETGDRGADHPRRVERGRVQRDRVRKVLIAHQFPNESLARRGVERRRRAEQEGEHIDVPELHEAGDGEKPERRRERPHRRLRGHEELALIQAVGGRSRPRQEQQLRPELQRHHRADRRGAVMGEPGEHQPGLRRALHPGADIGDEGPGGPHPVIENAQRAEDARAARGHGRCGAAPSLNRPKCRAEKSAIASTPIASAAASARFLRSKSPT